MAKRIPYFFWPAIGLTTLWAVALICNLFGGAIDQFGAYCARAAMGLSMVIVPLTIALVVLPGLVGERKRLTKKSIVLRIVVAAFLTATTLAVWPHSCRRPAMYSEVHRAGRLMPGKPLKFLDADMKAAIPRGEIELRDLPLEIADRMGVPIESERTVDRWGNPYMLVAEDRDHGLWVGTYSTGQDGVSNSMGNDPDDLNSWGQDGSEYYFRPVQQAARIEFLVMSGVVFAFFFSICWLSFR